MFGRKGYFSILGALTILVLVIGFNGQANAIADVDVVTSFDAARGELPEGIAIDKMGNIYASVGPPFFVGGGYGAIFKIEPNGNKTKLVEFPEGPAPAGLTVDPSGVVYFALPNPGVGNGGVYRILDGGGVERLSGTENIVLPNGVALDKQGDLFVSDSILGAIWRIPAKGSGFAEIWLQHELVAGCTPADFGANGIAFWKGDLYVANTGRGALVKVPVAPDGSSGEPMIVAGNTDCEPAGLFGMDGIALDVHGNVYGLLVLQNKFVRIDPTDGSYTELFTEADGLWNPASLAFGTGKGDKESIFIANYAVLPPEPANSKGPAILKVDMGVPGLPLP